MAELSAPTTIGPVNITGNQSTMSREASAAIGGRSLRCGLRRFAGSGRRRLGLLRLAKW